MIVKRWLGSNAVDVVIRAVVVATLIISAFTYIRWHDLSACQASYNQAYAQYAAAARDTRQEDNAVLQQLLSSLRNAIRTTNKVLAQKIVDEAFERYFLTIEKDRKFQLAHPPPPLPDQYCG